MIDVKNERFDEKTNEYVYDVEMSDEELALFTELAKENNMSIEQYMSYCIEYAVTHPEEFKKLIESAKE